MANYGLKAMYNGKDAILSAFKAMRGNNPYYSVWYGRDMLFQYSGQDLEEGYDQLADILEAAEQNDNTDILTIKFHPKPKGDYITSKSEVVGTMPVRVVPFDSANEVLAGTSTGMLAPPVYNMFKDIRNHMGDGAERIAALEAKIGALETAQTVEPVEKDIFEKISDILAKPGVSDIVLKLFTMLPISGIMNPQPNIQMNGVNEQPVNGNPVHMVGTAANDVNTEAVRDDANLLTDEDNDKIDAALIILAESCNIVEVLPKLAAFSQSDPKMFTWLLGQLK